MNTVVKKAGLENWLTGRHAEEWLVRTFGKTLRQDVAMPKRSRTVTGRPSKGDRKVVYSRVPREIADRVEAEAERLDLAYSDVIANALARYFDLPPVVTSPSEDHMKLTA